jgi:hypothetical protein
VAVQVTSTFTEQTAYPLREFLETIDRIQVGSTTRRRSEMGHASTENDIRDIFALIIGIDNVGPFSLQYAKPTRSVVYQDG